MTQNQISLAVSISGLVLGLVAIIVFFSAFTADAMCPEEDRNTIIVDGEETWTCDSDEFLWETKTTSRFVLFLLPDDSWIHVSDLTWLQYERKNRG